MSYRGQVPRQMMAAPLSMQQSRQQQRQYHYFLSSTPGYGNGEKNGFFDESPEGREKMTGYSIAIYTLLGGEPDDLKGGKINDDLENVLRIVAPNGRNISVSRWIADSNRIIAHGDKAMTFGPDTYFALNNWEGNKLIRIRSEHDGRGYAYLVQYDSDSFYAGVEEALADLDISKVNQINYVDQPVDKSNYASQPTFVGYSSQSIYPYRY